MKIKFNLNFTTTKLLAYVAVIGGFIVSGITKDSSLAIVCISAGTLMQTGKTLSEAFGKDNTNV